MLQGKSRCHGLPCRNECVAAARRHAEAAEEGSCLRLSRLRARRLGAHRQGLNSGGHRQTKARLAELRVGCCLRILRGRRAHVDRNCFAHSSTDMVTCRQLSVARVLHWSNYSAKVVARIQATGMPIDMRLWNLVQENKAAVVRELLRTARSELWLWRDHDLHTGGRMELCAIRELSCWYGCSSMAEASTAAVWT